jgi:hypothetical protein
MPSGACNALWCMQCHLMHTMPWQCMFALSLSVCYDRYESEQYSGKLTSGLGTRNKVYILEKQAGLIGKARVTFTTLHYLRNLQVGPIRSSV